MAMKVSAARLAALFTYDPSTGVLTWKERPRSEFKRDRDCNAWNATNAGRVAGCINAALGYHVVGVDRRKLYAHHIVWAICFGRAPSSQIDHINGNRADNRVANLRDVTEADNKKNQKRYSTNTSGVTGVYRHKDKWRARIASGKVTHDLGCFDCLAKAAAARRAANIHFGFHPNHGRAA